MTEASFFWTTNDTGDGPLAGYPQASLFSIFRGLFAKSVNAGGVSPDYANELAVSGTSSPVAVATGAAVVYGIPYVSDAQVNVAVPTPTTATRIDRIVLRASWSAQTVRVTRIAGTEGGAAPSLTQSAGTTWDIPLAQVSITTGGVITVTDEREWLSAVGDGGIGTVKLADNAVTTAKIIDDAVTQDKIGAGAVGTTELANDAVTTSKIATGAVDTTDIADSAVTTDKLGTAAVTADKLASGAVETAKLASASVTQSKLGSDTLQQIIIPIPLGPLASGKGYLTLTSSHSSFSDEERIGHAWLDGTKLPAGATVKLLLLAVTGAHSGTVGVELTGRGNGSVTTLMNSNIGFTSLYSDGTLQGNISTDLSASITAFPRVYRLRLRLSSGADTSVYGAALLVEW